MSKIGEIGVKDPLVSYVDRPTVKVIITKASQILILNDGLLPGGGIEPGESSHDAIKREVQEELGAEVDVLQALGSVVQYRSFLQRRYIVEGYIASLDNMDGMPRPQDRGEATFVYKWLEPQAALRLVEASIEQLADIKADNDGIQGKVYNLQTTRLFLKKYIQSIR